MEVRQLNIAICDDNQIEADLIYKYLDTYLNKNDYDSKVHVYDSGESLLEAFSTDTFSVVFLDIYMSGITGIETAIKLRAKDSNFALIFITSSKDHALEAFSCQASAYLIKPVNHESIEGVFKQCESIFLKNARTIQIVSDRKPIKIPICKIYYIEIFHKDALFHTSSGVFKTNIPLNIIEKELGMPFLRCHRSHLVNMNHIEEIGEHDISMKNGDCVSLRQREKKRISEIYGDFLSNRLFWSE